MSFPAPQIIGNQGVFFCSNWGSAYQTSSAGNAGFDIAYTDLIPTSYGSTPNLLITSATILTFGPQTLNGGSAFLKIERPDTDTTFWWAMLCCLYDGQMGKQQNHVPGVRMTHLENLCFQAFWQAYASGPNGFGGSGTERVVDVQVAYTIEA